MAIHSTEGIRKGDVLSYWHDDNMGGVIAYAVVEKVCKRKLLVRDEQGRTGYKYPQFFVRKTGHEWPYVLTNN